MPDARITSPQEWRYVSEGGATIVFSYVGSAHEDFFGTVIRLRKTPRVSPPIIRPLANAEEGAGGPEVPISIVDDDEQEDNKEYDEESDDPTIAFQGRVTSLLIPLEHLPRLESCRVSKRWLERLAQISESSRPAERIAKDGIDLRKRKAVLATDLVGGAGLAVEIKPKWAFLPNSRYLSPETRQAKTSHSRFVMHTHFRSLKADGEEGAATAYDPIDLFSNDEERVAGAIKALWDAWIASGGAANNLRLFVNGTSIDPRNERALELLAPHLPTTEPITNLSLDTLLEPFTTRILPLILSKHLMPALARLQRTLDSLDIEGLSALWTRVRGPDLKLGQGESEPTLDEWQTFANEYLTRSHVLSRVDPQEEELRYHLLAYLMSATFKDCSVILRLPPPGSDAEATITAIDLDPKSVERLKKWEELDRDIVLAYNSHKGY